MWCRVILVFGALVAAGCQDSSSIPEPRATSADESALQSAGSGKDQQSKSQTLPDGLTLEERDRFNQLSMGSELIPLDWLRVLRSHKTGKPFLEQIDRFGLLEDPRDPHGLPIGLTAAPSAELKGLGLVVGFNCAACHTGQLRYQNQTVVMTGGQGLFDVTGFTGELFASMAATAKEPRELLAFVNRVWNARSQKADEDKELSRHMRAFLAHLDASRGEVRKRIEQRVQSLIEEATRQKTSPSSGDPTNAERLRNLWQGFDKTRHSIIEKTQEMQWPIERLSQTHAAEAVHRFSRDLYVSARILSGRGAMARQVIDLKQRALPQTIGGPGRVDDFNAGRNLLFPPDQAVGMTSPCSIPPLWGLKAGEWTDWDGNTTSALGRSMLTALAGGAAFDPKTHLSSVSPQNLLELEALSQKLHSPKWPEAVLGALDHERVARGKLLFEDHCRRCHRSIDSEAASLHAQPMDAVIPLTELGTDSERIQNFAKPVSGRSLAEALQEVSKLYLEKACESAEINREAIDAMERTHPNQWRHTEGYVARSLVGVWATAPYLHNGSVPTLADLLLSPDNRPVRFWIGSGEFDREKVGYQSVEGDGFQFDATRVGNRNSGHLYGTELSASEKRDLLEFLKSL